MKFGKKNGPLIFIAALKNRSTAVRLLLDRGARLNSSDDIGRTPAYVAAEFGNLEALEVLREAADLNIAAKVIGATTKTFSLFLDQFD